MRRRNEVLVGSLTLVAIAILVMGTLWLVRGGLQRGYPVYAVFEWGAGLKQGQPVLFSGVNVGYVDRIELLDNGGLVVTLRVYKEQHIPVGSTATIVPNGIFGDVAVALRASAPTSQRIAVGDTIPTVAPDATLSDVIARVDSVAQNLVSLTSALNSKIIDANVIDELRGTVRTATSVFQTLERVVAEQSVQLTSTHETVRRFAGAIDSAQIDSTVRGVQDATSGLTRLVDDLRSTTHRFDSLMVKFESGDGTAGKLLSDPALYNDFRALVHQADSLISDIKANPRKYIRFSVF
jgi:phospholipid/cholesterol/gamma-HCH transport system substrate-binding protein